MAFEYILILVMTVELLIVILSVIEGYHRCTEWSAEVAGPATAVYTYAESCPRTGHVVTDGHRIYILD